MSSVETRTIRLAEIVAKYEHKLHRFLSRYLSTREDVEDCTQEALLHVWRQELRGLLPENPQAYLFTTALNVARDFGRRARVRHAENHVELSENTYAPRSMCTERLAAEREAVRLVEAHLDKLRPTTKAVFLLYYAENLAPEKIAAQLGISVRTVERDLARALEFYRSVLAGSIKAVLED